MGVVLFDTNQNNDQTVITRSLQVQEIVDEFTLDAETSIENNKVVLLEDAGYIVSIFIAKNASLYFKDYADNQTDNSFKLETFNTTKELGRIAQISSLDYQFEFIKIDIDAEILTSDFDVDDFFDLSIDFNKNNSFEAVSIVDYTNIPLSSGLYQVSNASLTTVAKSYEDNSKYILNTNNITVKRKKVINTGSYKSYVDEIYRYQVYVGSLTISIYGSNDPSYSDMYLSLDFLPFNYYMPADNSFNYLKGKMKFTLKESDFLEEGLIKMPFNFLNVIDKAFVLVDNKEIKTEFVYISNSQTLSIICAIRDINGFTSKEKSVNTEVKIILNYNNLTADISTFKPATEKFASSISNRSIVNKDLNLSHSNKMKTWVTEFWTNNLTGSNPTIKGYEIANLHLRLGNDTYRKDAMYYNDADLLMSALGSSSENLSKDDKDANLIKIVGHGSNDVVELNITESINTFFKDMIMVVSREETDNDGTDPEGTSYGYGVEFSEPTRIADLTAIGLTPDIDTHQQSPATAIVTAKFKWLRNETGAPWALIREACRATASNAGTYNIYRGFGQIDTAAAKTYIENNIDTWTEYNTTELAKYYDAISPYNTEVKLEEKTDKTPVVKKDLENFVNTTNNQTINGIKTFNNNVTVKELFLIENPNGSIKKAYSLTGNEGLRVDIGATMPNFFTVYDNSATNQVVFQVMQTSLGGHILFQPNGNIGIGLPNPSEKLEVNGKIKANSIWLKSPDGNYHEVTVDNSGNLVVS